MSHIDETTLNDCADGAADPRLRAAVERHLTGCEHCRARLDALLRLRGELDALPREIAPPRDLRPAIRSRIAQGAAPTAVPDEPREPTPAPPEGAPGRTFHMSRTMAAAAAILLVAATAAVTRFIVLRSAEPTASSPTVSGSPASPPIASVPIASSPTTSSPAASASAAAAPAGVPASPPAPLAPPRTGGGAPLVRFREAEHRYVAAIAELQGSLDREKGELSPETIRILERNLRLIDRAIAESRAALDHDPDNAALRPMILSAYDQKLELLRRARQESS